MDQLSNSMEHFSSKHEFVNYMIKETGLTDREISTLYDRWWELGGNIRTTLPYDILRFSSWVALTIIGAYGDV